MRHQPTQQLIGLGGVAQVAGAVERVKSGVDQIGRIADVMQPRGGDKQIGVLAEDGLEGKGLGSDALRVCPPAGQRHLKDRAGGVFRPVS